MVRNYCSFLFDYLSDEHDSINHFCLLMTGVDRSNYLLIKEARIVAMTCTHAALKRHDLVKLGFKVRWQQVL